MDIETEVLSHIQTACDSLNFFSNGKLCHSHCRYTLRILSTHAGQKFLGQTVRTAENSLQGFVAKPFLLKNLQSCQMNGDTSRVNLQRKHVIDCIEERT